MLGRFNSYLNPYEIFGTFHKSYVRQEVPDDHEKENSKVTLSFFFFNDIMILTDDITLNYSLKVIFFFFKPPSHTHTHIK